MNDQQQPSIVETEQESFPLDDATIGLLADIGNKIDQNVAVLNAQRQGALVLFIRQHKLDGNWQLAENGKELVRSAAPATQGR